MKIDVKYRQNVNITNKIDEKRKQHHTIFQIVLAK